MMGQGIRSVTHRKYLTYRYYVICPLMKVILLCLTLCEPQGLYSSPSNSPGQNTGVGSQFPSPGDLPNPGIEPRSPAPQTESLPAEPPGTSPNTLGEMQIKTTVRYHFTTTRMAIIKKHIITSTGQDGKKLEPSYTVGENIKWYISFGK